MTEGGEERTRETIQRTRNVTVGSLGLDGSDGSKNSG